MSANEFDHEFAPALSGFEPIDLEEGLPSGMQHMKLLEAWYAPAFEGNVTE